MRSLRQFVVFHLGLLWFCAGLTAQDVQMDFRHFTTDDGLPSSEVYTVLEDQEGYIWVGTDNGVARFDGYSFEVFDSDDGLGDVVVFYLIMDDHGTIWAGTYSGKVYYFNNGQFVEFAHNDQLEKVRAGNEMVHLLDINPAGDLIFRLRYSGLIKVSETGEVAWLSDGDSDTFYLYAPLEEEQGLFDIPSFVRFYPTSMTNGREGFKRSCSFMVGNGAEWQKCGELVLLPYSSSNKPIPAVTTMKNDLLAIVSQKSISLISPNQEPLVFPNKIIGINQAIRISDTEIWLLVENGIGLIRATFTADYSSMKSEKIFADASFSLGVFDSKGGLWLGSTDEGLFYCPSTIQKKYVKNANDKMISIELLKEDVFYSGSTKGKIFFFNDSLSEVSLEVLRNFSITLPVHTIVYDSMTQLVMTSNYHFKHSEKAGSENPIEGKLFYNKDGSGATSIFVFNKTVESLNSKYLLTNKVKFGVFDAESQEISLFNRNNLNGDHTVESIIEAANGKYLLGTLTGIKEVDLKSSENSAVPYHINVPELQQRVSQIISLQKGSTAFGTRGNGVVIISPQDTFVIGESDGLASDMVRNLHQSDDGTIWVSTLNGLSKVELTEDTFKLRTFRTENGLIDNEVHMVDTYGDAVFLATSGGIQRFIEQPINTDSPQPVIRLLTADGDTLPVRGRMDLGSGYHSVNIDYSTINHRLGSNINYRYRLDDGEDWSFTQQRTVSFARLGAGTFNFSVHSQNEDGLWSDETRLTIDIPKKWYNTVYAWGGLTFLLGTIIFGFFYVRDQRRKKDQDFIFQISKLEHEALHARMNPHFVFNCLNSIQNFVLENDTRSAATYLSRFSSLIRQILRSSVHGKHTLKEEIEMLEKYLDLEKLRFKTAFTHKITVDPALDPDAISLAPLLVQPFVENAIVHGMKGRKRGGRISVEYSGSSHLLKVTVTDNGIGIHRELPKKKDSMGMDITLQRLGMMNHGGETKSGMTISSIYTEKGEVAGTKVELAIVPEKL